MFALEAELEEIATFFAEDSRHVLYTYDATRGALLQNLPQGTYLHFACDGFFDVAAPLDSHLVLSAEETLTLRDLLYGDAQLHEARLAVLSACQTAIRDFGQVPDECIGLPAGFLQAGVPGVVGTLCPVNDFSTALAMVKFYELQLRGDVRTGEAPMMPGQALCRAQQWLRNVTSGELTDYFTRHHQLNEARRQNSSRMPDDIVLEGLARFALRWLRVLQFS